MVQHQGAFAELVDVDPVLTDIFFDHYNAIPDITSDLFAVRGSSKAKETDDRIGGFSDPIDFDTVGSVPYDTASNDYQIEYSHTHFVRGFQITQVMLEDMQYDNIFQNAANMGTAFARKRAKDAMSVFNNAFTAGASAGYDAVALCSASHPRSQADATAVSNTLTLALNSANLETAITTLQGVGDDLGEEINVMPNILLVPRALRKTALELTESEYTPGSANNAVNVHAGMQTLVSGYLTDSNAWFVIDSNMAKQGYLKWFNRVMTAFAAEDSFDSLIRKFRGRMRYSYGWSDWRWLIGSNPS